MDFSFKNIVGSLFIFISIFTTLYALFSNDYTTLFNFSTYFSNLNISVAYSALRGDIGNWDFKYGILNINLNFMATFVTYLAFIPYYIVSFFIDLFSFISQVFLVFIQPFALLPSPFNTIVSGFVLSILIISFLMSIEIASTKIGGNA